MAKHLRAGIIKRIHVDKHIIARNLKNGPPYKPCITIQTSRGSIKVRCVRIGGASEMIYRPEKPLSCGARVWVETRAPVSYDE